MTFKGFDNSDVDELVADLAGAGLRAGVNAIPVVHRAANNIQRTARDLAPGGRRTPYYPESITYDMEIGATVAAEVGPDKQRRQGALGNLLEYGKPGQAPHPHLGPALDREQPNFLHFMEELGANSLGFR